MYFFRINEKRDKQIKVANCYFLTGLVTMTMNILNIILENISDRSILKQNVGTHSCNSHGIIYFGNLYVSKITELKS